MTKKHVFTVELISNPFKMAQFDINPLNRFYWI